MRWNRIAATAAALALAALGTAGYAQGDALIRKNLAERVPQLRKIDEVRKTEMPGVYEVRTGTDLFYTDAEGNFLIAGQLIDTRTKHNLTQERIDKLTAIDFAALPMKDAFTIVRGDGKRKLAVFEDPNCPYCKRFEHDLQKVDNVTIYMFLYPILGADSMDKSRNIWCAKDKGRVWQDLMVGNRPVAAASCDTGAVTRNVEFGRKHNITGTPTLILVDGNRVPGAVSAAQVEKLLAAAK
ncbi:MAG TPA: DsbC family protein [Ramlibacter sp.]|nr:DsbC family protein [Ramlibacter sp.]